MIYIYLFQFFILLLSKKFEFIFYFIHISVNSNCEICYEVPEDKMDLDGDICESNDITTEF